MTALNNCHNDLIPRTILLDYIKLYKCIGNCSKYVNELDRNSNLYHKLTIEEDITYCFNMFFKDHKLSDTRIKQFLNKRSGFVPKTYEENIFVNLMNIFELIHSDNKFVLSTREIQDLGLMIYKNTKDKNNTIRKHNANEQSVSLSLDELVNEYNRIKNTDTIEYLYLNISFIVDFIHLKPLKNGNEIVASILLYILLLSSDISALKYSSFFKVLSSRKEEYNDSILKALYLYDAGYSDTSFFLKLIIKLSIELFEDVKNLSKVVEFDSKLKKSETVETVIYKLDEKFTKEEIRKKLPNVSDSTIDRCLKELQDEGKIISYGRGRSAYWIRLDHSHDEGIDFLNENA